MRFGILIASGFTSLTLAPALAEAPRVHWILGGHGSQVRDVAVSPDGELAASASEDGTVKIWRASDGRLRSTLLASDTQAFASNGVAFSPDGSLIAGTGTGGARLWRVSDGQPIAVLSGFETGYGIAFSPNGELVGIAGSITGLEEAAGIFRTSDGAMLLEFTGSSGFYGFELVFAPDGQSFFISSGSPFAAGNAGAIKRVRISDGHVLESLLGHTRRITGLAISPDGTTLVSGSEDASVRFWRVFDGAPLDAISNAHAGEITHVTFSSDGQYVASSGLDAVIRIWRVSDRSLTRTIVGHVGPVSSAAFMADDRKLLTAGGRTLGGGGDHTIRRWSVTTSVEEDRFTCFSTRAPLISYAAPARRIIASNGASSVRVFDDWNGGIIRSFEHGAYVSAVALSPDGTTAASVGTSPPARLWNVINGQQYASIPMNSALSPGLAFSPDSSIVAVSSWNEGISLHRTSDGELLRSCAQSATGGRDPTFSPDGSLIAAVNGSSAMVWRVSDGVRLRVYTVSGFEGQRVEFSPDNQRIAVGGIGPNVRIFNVADGALIRLIVTPSWTIRALAFSPNGDYLVTGTQIHSFESHLWRLSDGALVATIDQQIGTGVEDITFAADGRRIFLSRLDGVVAAVFNPILPACPADVDADGDVGLHDLALLLANFGTPTGASPATGDIDDDGDVDLTDLATLLAYFGSGCA